VLVLVIVAGVGEPAIVQADRTYVVTFFMADDKYDEGWNAAHDDGVRKLMELGDVIKEWDMGFVVDLADKRFYDKLEVNLVTNVGQGSGIEGKIRSAIEVQSPDMTFETWWTSKDAVSALAPEFPEVIFNHCSGYPVITSEQFSTRNVATYFVRMYYADFVVGKVAGRNGHNKVGVVATFPIPEPVRGFNAFAQGLQAGLREAGMNDDVEINIIWIEEWLHREKELLATRALIDAGYEMIKQGADTPTTAQTACEEGVDVLGYGRDTLPTASCTMVTNEWDWGDYYVKSVLAGIKGRWQPHDYYEEGTNIVFHPDTPQDVLDMVAETTLEEVWAGPINGYGYDENGERYEIFIPDGSVLTDEDLLSMQWLHSGIQTGQQPSAPKFRFAVE